MVALSTNYKKHSRRFSVSHFPCSTAEVYSIVGVLARFLVTNISTDNLGLMPYRHPIVSVVGKAIEVEQTSNPSQEMLEDVQSRYIDELMR